VVLFPGGREILRRRWSIGHPGAHHHRQKELQKPLPTVVFFSSARRSGLDTADQGLRGFRRAVRP
jgi:hypothetical protein